MLSYCCTLHVGPKTVSLLKCHVVFILPDSNEPLQFIGYNNLFSTHTHTHKKTWIHYSLT